MKTLLKKISLFIFLLISFQSLASFERLEDGTYLFNHPTDKSIFLRTHNGLPNFSSESKSSKFELHIFERDVDRPLRTSRKIGAMNFTYLPSAIIEPALSRALETDNDVLSLNTIFINSSCELDLIALISETPVKDKLHGQGRGTRSMEALLAALPLLLPKDRDPILVLDCIKGWREKWYTKFGFTPYEPTHLLGKPSDYKKYAYLKLELLDHPLAKESLKAMRDKLAKAHEDLSDSDDDDLDDTPGCCLCQ